VAGFQIAADKQVGNNLWHWFSVFNQIVPGATGSNVGLFRLNRKANFLGKFWLLVLKKQSQQFQLTGNRKTEEWRRENGAI
jgi:hypothetical protein